MNTKEIYIMLKGNRKVVLNDLTIKWSDKYGDHAGKVVSYGLTHCTSGSPVTHQKYVYTIDCGDDGVRELRPHELRDILEVA